MSGNSVLLINGKYLLKNVKWIYSQNRLLMWYFNDQHDDKG